MRPLLPPLLRSAWAQRTKGSVGEGEGGKKAKVTQHAGGKSVSEKSQVTRTGMTHTHTHTPGHTHTLTIVSRTHTFHCH